MIKKSIISKVEENKWCKGDNSNLKKNIENVYKEFSKVEGNVVQGR